VDRCESARYLDALCGSGHLPQALGVSDVTRQQVAWSFWAVGTVLIVLSWFKVVAAQVGWIGFGIGMVGSVMGWGLTPPKSTQSSSTPPDQGAAE